MNIDNLTFIECPTCAAKPGSPTLCTSCLINRDAIEKLHKEFEAQAELSRKRLMNAFQLIKNGKQISYLKFDGFEILMGEEEFNHNGDLKSETDWERYQRQCGVE